MSRKLCELQRPRVTNIHPIVTLRVSLRRERRKPRMRKRVLPGGSLYQDLHDTNPHEEGHRGTGKTVVRRHQRSLRAKILSMVLEHFNLTCQSMYRAALFAQQIQTIAVVAWVFVCTMVAGRASHYSGVTLRLAAREHRNRRARAHQAQRFGASRRVQRKNDVVCVGSWLNFLLINLLYYCADFIPSNRNTSLIRIACDAMPKSTVHRPPSYIQIAT